MMRGIGTRALVVGILCAGLFGGLHALGVGLWLLLALGIVVVFIAWATPWIGVRLLDDVILAVRSLFWSREQGRFHSFAGVPLEIEDDGRDVWVGGDGLQRALGRHEPDAALAARHAGCWRRCEDGALMLRVDAVVAWLNTMPGRDRPRVQKLRRYFEREVLFPAAQRRRQR